MSEQSAASDGDKYTIHSRQEIRTLLRRLSEQHCLLTAYFDEGRHFLLTAILGFSEDGRYLVLDASPDQDINERTLRAKRLLCSSQLERVELRFGTGPAEMIQHEGLPAFRVPAPTSMRYLQRREYYRLLVPVTHTLECVIRFPADEHRHARTVQTRVIDISLGGVALLLPPEAKDEFEPGAMLPDCQLTLPDTGRIEATLRVCHVFETNDGRGLPRTQAGCEFVALATQSQSLVQRYILRVERKRIARERGLI
ncbi:flagellar brake protein [Rehaibacterium terrae]|jgi:c-di-GMP-binding flagellar brake protein YcgR|uniref:Flagellar brake protein YcgR n=1 Tax=Rehaibacterium terrae TaxID=1341696 RepID=A0A7W7XZH6_9GAMM|nr:flagellar brake protein [Rehaibacterium terrae]MBB5015326.1 c-di-GMP-binding flagellar brake protein YcgR [Rehaibacterium terrae]